MLRVNPVDLTHPEAHKVNKQLLGIHTLASTFDVLRLDKQAAMVRRLVKKQQDGTIGEVAEGDMGDEEDTNVVIGDTYNTYHAAAQEAAAQTAAAVNPPQAPQPIQPAQPPPPQQPIETAPPPQVPAPGISLSPKKAALWAALALAAGGGLGAGSLALYRTMTGTDTNTQYRLEFADPQAVSVE